MKICGYCGYRDFAPKKKCPECQKVYDAPPLNAPMIGHTELSEAEGRLQSSGHRISPLKTPNE